GFLILLVVATAFEFGIRTPDIPVASTIVVFALFNLNLIVFLLLLVLLFRNLVKLSFERRQKVIGSRFKAKLVLAFLLLALAPALVEQQEQLGLSALTVFNTGGHDLVHVKDPVLGDLPTAEISARLVRQGLDGQEVTTVREIQAGDLIQAVTPVWSVPAG